MARTITAAMVTEITAATLTPRILAYFDFPSGAVRFWNGIGTLSYDSQSWIGVGNLGGIKPDPGGMDLSAQGTIFTLSGIPASTISLVLTEAWQNRACEFHFAILNAADAVIATPVKWQGRMDTISMSENADGATITIRAESRMIDFDRARERRYSDEDQQAEYAGDVGLEYAALINDMQIHWGHATPRPASYGTPLPLSDPRTKRGG